MAIFLDASQKQDHYAIFDWMFRSRAAVFKDRLGWDVEVVDGYEIDRYDKVGDPLYILVQDKYGSLVGSLRLLPTTGDTMLEHDFSYMFDEPVNVRSPLIWECTRFCVAPDPVGVSADTARQASSDLLIALCSYCLETGIEQIQGLYDVSMMRIYRRIGWSPVVMARAKPEAGNLCVGLWDVSLEALEEMKRIAADASARRVRAA